MHIFLQSVLFPSPLGDCGRSATLSCNVKPPTSAKPTTMNPDQNYIDELCKEIITSLRSSWDPWLSTSTPPTSSDIAVQTNHVTHHTEDSSPSSSTWPNGRVHNFGGQMDKEYVKPNVTINARKPNHMNYNSAITQTKKVDKSKKKLKYPNAAANMFTSIDSVMMETYILMKESKEVLSERARIEWCLKDLQSIKRWYRAFALGSRILGLAGHDSDLDIFLDTGGMYFGYEYQDAHSQSDFVADLAKGMRAHGKVWKHVWAIPSARTPIVKAFHYPTKLQCDVSVRHGLGCENTQLLAHMMDVVPVTKPLILILKKWFNNSGLVSQIKSFTLSIMVIFYLQVRRFLPSIATLRSFYCGEPKFIAGWECHFSKRPSALKQLDTPPNFIDLLHGFFNYYSRIFNFDTQIVCPLMGKTVLKRQFEDNGAELPPEMSRYKYMVSQVSEEERSMSKVSKYVMDHPYKEVFRHDAPMCIQDPFDLSHNLTKAAPQHFVEKFQKFCSIEAEKCEFLKKSIDLSHYEERFWNV